MESSRTRDITDIFRDDSDSPKVSNTGSVEDNRVQSETQARNADLGTADQASPTPVKRNSGAGPLDAVVDWFNNIRVSLAYNSALVKRQGTSKREPDDIDWIHIDAERAKLWEERVIPNWEMSLKNKAVHRLWWEGLPPRTRGTIWTKSLGNPLGIEATDYQRILSQVRRIKGTSEGNTPRRQRRDSDSMVIIDAKTLQFASPSPQNDISAALEATENALSAPDAEDGDLSSHTEDKKALRNFGLIEIDTPRTFGWLRIFAPDGPLHQSLENVLNAWCCYEPEVGYVQGMSYLACMLLLSLDEFEAFRSMATMLNRPVLRDVYTLSREKLDDYIDCFDIILANHNSELARHMSEIGLRADMFVIDWFMTLYSKSLNIDLSSRIWDIYMLEGEGFLFRVAVGLVSFSADRIREAHGFDEALPHLARLPEGTDAEELFKTINSVKLSTTDLYNIMQAKERRKRVNALGLGGKSIV
eukprot:Clim_evm5s9 gene=Clim_evmTU5s9